MNGDPGRAVIAVHGGEWVLEAGATLSFGRSATCDIRIGADDHGVSRRAGEFRRDGPSVVVVNTSDRVTLLVVDEFGMPHPVAPLRSHVIVGTPAQVVVQGSIRGYALAVRMTEAPPAAVPVVVADGEAPTTYEVELGPKDRLALLALFEGYLRPFPRYQPHPRTYAEAAERLGWRKAALTRRVDRIRERLTDAGVPNVVGDHGLDNLAQFVLTGRLLTPEDLPLLDAPPATDDD
ncbi:MAG TPA: FHA domain-containing protein [Acidimicrobiales bacterium]